MALQKQIHIYSLDTSCFYNYREMIIHNRMSQLYVLRYQVETHIKKLEKELHNSYNEDIETRIDFYKSMVQIYNNMLKHDKERLYEELEYSKSLGGVRNLRSETLIDRNIVSVFESSLTRTMGLNVGELSDELMIVQTYYFDVIEDIIKNGFYYGNEKYIVLTASAGQIRTKKTVFIKEKSWNKYYNTITCGLSLEDINKKGGVNVNKYLAYLALSNSATDVWEDFNIEKAIVVDDFETLVEGEVDFVDETNYTVTRKTMKVPIPHMDGCGIMLPDANNSKSTMVRLPWVKGLLVPFNFKRFIQNKRIELSDNTIGIIKDIKGKEHDIIKEDIQYIFTASQWKMHKYYDTWEDYVDKFKKYNCEACKCNEEENFIPDAKLNYQMLQTLTDMTTDELKEIAQKTIDDINKIGTDRETMLKILGATKANQNKNYLQQALSKYPELLQDTYSREILKQVKKSLVKDAKAGKLFIDGKYTFLIPDLYAFCEWLFLGDENPKGLLKNGEVYCNLFDNGDKLDVLRSPHLYREHAVRQNVANKEIKNWFCTKGIYTSCHDMISKILQFDNDGDKGLVCREKKLVEVAERNMNGIVPLYYDMKKAPSQCIDKDVIYGGLKAAYTGGNIGIYSNDISKIWNSNKPNLEVIKLLCCENNFVIDYAKTLYKPERPKRIGKLITSYTKAKVPHFFVYAKDKDENRVEPLNNSVVNRLEHIIPNKMLKFKAQNLGKFDYRKLYSNYNFTYDKNSEEIISKYIELDKKKFLMVNTEQEVESNYELYMYEKIREEILKVNSNVEYVVNVLIKYLYETKPTGKKLLLWSSFGDVLVENLNNNIDETIGKDIVLCERCGERVEITTGNKTYCSDECRNEAKKEKDRERMRLKRLNSRKLNIV